MKKLRQALEPLIDRACREFTLRAPDRFVMQDCSALGMFGQTEHRENGQGVWVTISTPEHDPLLLLTLAHELAHLGKWKHGRKHDSLTVQILDFWQKRMPAEVRAVLRACQ